MEQLTLDQQRIVSENHNLIYSLANKKSINLDEYYDVLAIGLCKAAIAFDNTKGKFSTLAYTVMLNEYKQELRKQQNERAIPQDKLLSFDVPIQTDQDNQFASFADVIPDNNVQVEQEAIHALTYKSLSSKLKPDEQVIFAMLLDDKNQSEIASELGVSRQRIAVFSFQGTQNKAISLEEQISTAQSEIKVQEKRRADLIPNLVDCVQAYDEHEYQTLMDVVNARGSATDESVQEIQTMIQAVAEAYPELKSSENYRELMNELATTENLIANYRSNFNTWVKNYNQYVRKFPNKQILGFLGYEVINYEYLNYDVSSDAPTNLFD